MKPLFTSLFLLCATSLIAYQTAEIWYPGQVKLMDGAELIGDIHYDLSFQTIRVKVDGQTTTLSEEQLTSMVIFIEKFRHEFKQVAIKNEQGDLASTFAKVIYRSRSNYSLYKEYIAVTDDFDIDPTADQPINRERSTDSKKDPFLPKPGLGTSIGFRFFLADAEGNHQPISALGFRNAYGRCYDRINNFKVRNRLSIQKESDLVRMIRYTDSLPGGCVMKSKN